MKVPDTDASLLSDEELMQTFRLDAAQLARAASRVADDPNATIEPNRSADAVGLQALQSLAQTTAGRTLANGLEMRRTLGEGGMGIVHLAVQRSLGREVAVKTLRKELRSEAAVLRLLREAWVTGLLEHPNVVPVYDLSLDDTGAPIIVLKRIEGVSWDKLMHEPDEIEARFGATDPLEWNLGILVRVASALSLAHSRGILHRDLKPENVMIGSFGEVYVVDWGIAVSLRDDPTGRMPTSVSDLAGTPAYMSPEMFGLDGLRLTERSDVYLLGGILYEILTGHAPHEGATIRVMLLSAMASMFKFPNDAPKPLVAIAERALSRNMSDRFASAAEFQQRLEWYLRHRGSLALSAEASARLQNMLEEAASPTAAADRVHRLFSECRFGFRAALRASDDNEEASNGLRVATEAVARFELSRGAPQAAAAALAELENAPPELSAEVAEAVAKHEERRRKLAHLETDLDRAIGRNTRMFLTAVFGAFWTVGPLVARHFYFQRPDLGASTLYRDMIIWSVSMTGLVLFASVWARESMQRTRLNRSLNAILFALFAGQLTLELGGIWLGIPPLSMLVMHLFLWFVLAVSMAITMERRFWTSVLAYLGAFLLSSHDVTWVWTTMAASTGVLVATLVFTWGRLEDAT